MTLTAKIDVPMDLNLSVVDAQGRTRRLKAYLIDGRRVVGVQPGERFEVTVYNRYHKRAAIRLSVGGIDTTTGNDAVASYQGPGEKYIVNPYSSTTIKTFMQGPKGGSSFVFTEAELSVAAVRGKAGLPKDLIAVAAWVDGYEPPPPAYSPRGGGLESLATPKSFGTRGGGDDNYRGGPTRSASLSADRGPSRGEEYESSMERSLGVGAGAFVEQSWQTVEGLKQPIFGGFFKIWFMPWPILAQKLTSQAADDQQVSGFILPETAPQSGGYADLGGVQQVGSAGQRLETGATDNEILAQWKRFED